MSEGTAAVLDRVEDGIAVLEPLDGGPAFELPARTLPAGAREGDCFMVKGEGPAAVLEPAPGATERRRGEMRSKLDMLRARRG